MLHSFNVFNSIVGTILLIAYSYQIFYTLYAMVVSRRRRAKPSRANTPLRRYAVLICARNEERVVGDLIANLKAQDYPAELLRIFVLADNCTDDTASAAQRAGATVFVRHNKTLVGKGYALDYLLGRIKRMEPDTQYDGYFVFDADNLVDPHFVSAMNETFDQGYDVLTSYRNSKNFAASWISASYSIWFLREARFLNFARMNLGTNCAVSGTGFLVSSRIIRENGGWPYVLLTEDIQFSAVCATRGWRIGYCEEAMLFDEQPTTMSQSWRQRMRWAKGFYQVNARCGLNLIRGCAKGPLRFSCYDMLMTIAPCVLLSVLTVVVNLYFVSNMLALPRFLAVTMLRLALRSVLIGLGWAYLSLMLYGLLTVVWEWNKIPAKPLQKLMYLPLFPLFMLTYIPISLAALVVNVQWKPIHHTSVKDLNL